MKKSSYRILTVFLVSVFLFAGCSEEFLEQFKTKFSDEIESGSIGEVEEKLTGGWNLYIANDNDDQSLPESWRSWWYFKVDRMDTSEPVSLTFKDSGWPYYYVPVYSYDNKEWFHFSEDEVDLNRKKEIVITKQFDESTVWIARFYPYTFSDLEKYVESIKNSPFIDVKIPGYTQEGHPVYLLKLTNSKYPASGKKRIIMHARTHPAETPSSFLIEGMIDYLLKGSRDAIEILSNFEIYIFPMQNVDGVIAGNYRSTPKSENLEMLWNYDVANPMELVSTTPSEVKVLHDYIVNLVNDGGPEITMALNLHASNSEPDICPFFYPHFGAQTQGYTAEQFSLWNKQLRFIDCVASNYGSDMIEPITEDGGGSFASKTYPESWWWVNFKDKVMAMTIEMTYGKSGYDHWIEPDDMRKFGVSVIKSIKDYHDESFNPGTSVRKMTLKDRLMDLKYPELYPPASLNEMKE